MRARRAKLDLMEKMELMRWKEKEKKHGVDGMGFLNKEKRARAEREKWMENQEHEVVMLNASLLVVDPLEERRRKKRARTAAWRKRSRKLKQTAAGT